ncbi:arginine repressor [Vagococcus sp.]|uniref:arginine repressor n=1 Tax=Vagococcus sp. TaxID=1933889 RepID=UPI003F9CC81C
MNKRNRQAIIRRLVSEHNISNQNELMALLKKEKVNTTQATISRDIRELNIIKRHRPNGKSSYHIFNRALSEMKKNTDKERLMNAVNDTGVSISQIEFMNLLNVLPGNGPSIGVLIDRLRDEIKEVVACVAGDDTILILSYTREDAEKVNKYFQNFLYEAHSSH